MTPAQKAYAIRWAKTLATPVVSCVQARLSPAHVLASCSRDDLEALVIVLADCADPVRVKAVLDAPGDLGMPEPDRADVLRKAHAEAVRLRRAGRPVPLRIAALSAEYRRPVNVRYRARKKAGGEASGRAA